MTLNRSEDYGIDLDEAGLGDRLALRAEGEAIQWFSDFVDCFLGFAASQ